MARVMCIANQKGGVGKTTTAINLADALARAGKRTLLIDLDPQCNATGGLGGEPTSRHALVKEETLFKSIHKAAHANMHLLPGSRSFKDIDQLAKGRKSSRKQLAEHLASIRSEFDFILIDCPPSLGVLTQAALAGADEVLMPIQCEYFAMEGLTQMIEVIRDVMNRRSGKLQFAGILLTMYDSSLELTREVDREVRDFFGEIVFETVVPRDVSVIESVSHGKSVIDYDPRSRGSRAYLELCMEILKP